MGIKRTVAVHSTLKPKNCVRYANEAICIGAPPSKLFEYSFDYQRGGNRNVVPIHPGYGFLAESEDLRGSYAKTATLNLSDRDQEVIRMMGDKVEETDDESGRRAICQPEPSETGETVALAKISFR